MRPTTLAEVRELLLRDVDGDGFPDALCAPVWIATGRGPVDVDAAVAAAAEFLVPLAGRALTLAVDIRSWDVTGCGFAIARHPPVEPQASQSVLRISDGGVIAHAHTASELIGAVVAFVGNAGAPEAARVLPGAQQLGLGALQHGDDGCVGATPYSGAYDHPERFVAGFAPDGGVPETLAVALRLALTGRDTPARVCADPARASVRTTIDATLEPATWSLRRRTGTGYRVELAAHDRRTLAEASRGVGSELLGTPDGQRFDDIEDALTSLVRGETRQGRLAAVASVVRAVCSEGASPRTASLASPPAVAPLRLGVPVANSARDGAMERWNIEMPWEGERLIEVAERLVGAARTEATHGRGATTYHLEVFASETLEIRHELQQRLRDLARQVPVALEVLPVRHAFRPALHWLLEEVVPRASGARRLRVQVGRQPERFGPPDRWLRELYPVAELIEQRLPDAVVELVLDDVDTDAPRYEATLIDAGGTELAAFELAPPTTRSQHPAGGEALVTSAGVRLVRAGVTVASEWVASDAEAFWRWLNGDVLPAIVGGLDRDATPLLHEISVVASLSEPDDLLDVDHETDSVVEVLHEEVYFGVLEAFDREYGGVGQRALSVGRVLPFFRSEARAPLRACVTVRHHGSDRLGVRTGCGRFVAAPTCNARVLVRALSGRGRQPAGLTLEVVGERQDVVEAVARLRWSAAQTEAPFPLGVAVTLAHEDGEPETIRAAAPLPAPPTALPQRPLHPREVATYARAWGAQNVAVRVATPRETVLGQPLTVIEVIDPSRASLSRARASAWRPTLLVSARQHANEATSTQAAAHWLEVWMRDPALHRRANLVVHPLENPDGARLHAACCSLAPNHMHHAARYTAFGADLQTNPRVRGAIIAESLLRHDAAKRWRPVAHLNDHGYPAHAWIRSLSGFIPRGFGDWSLPTGYLTILVSHDPDEGVAEALRTHVSAAVEKALCTEAAAREHTLVQVARGHRYRPAPATPFTFRSGLPFWLYHRPADGATDDALPHVPDGPDRSSPLTQLRPLVTLITEVPDETVAGVLWDRCVRAHERVNDAVARALLGWLDDRV